MIATALGAGYSGLGAWRSAQIARGVSSDAVELSSLLSGFFFGVVKSATAIRSVFEPVEELAALFRQCSTENWDGEGAAAIPESAFYEARELILVLPETAGRPTISPEPMGAFALEWYFDPKKILVLSVSGMRSIQYAAILGDGNEIHGKANFPGSLPVAVLQLIEAFHAL